jgi:16S rRNA (guanine527-N7)-methyltransferase
MTSSETAPDWLARRLAPHAQEAGVELSEGAIRGLDHFVRLVLDWGARINLTAARTPDRLVDEHIADALALFRHLPSSPFRYVDVGSGAGLPGLVIALVRGDASGVLLEPVGKKRAFLNHAIRELGLASRATASADRLAEHIQSGGAAAYDVAVSRAVWPASEWLGLGAPLLRPGGLLLGAEGAERGELPLGASRHPYSLSGRSRAVLTLRL